MSSRYFAIVCTWLLMLAAPCAHAFVDPPTLVPTNPTAGQTISVSVRIGECDGFTLRSGYPQITRTGNAIRIVLPAVHISNGLFCTVPSGTQEFAVGAFPPGDYTLQVDRIYTDDVNSGDVVETLGTLSFTIAANQSATAVPSSSGTSIALLIIGVFLVALLSHRRRQGLLLLAAATCFAVPAAVRAQAVSGTPYVFVLMSQQHGAPTPADIIDYLQAGKLGNPPSQALTTANPQSASYLLPFRASGDFRTYLLANPDSPRAKLERYLIVQYPRTADIKTALVAWSNDPFVQSAYLPDARMDFSSVELQDFLVTGPASVEDGQYGRDALNIDEAWLIAGGYGLIGDIDSGLAVDHPALRQFSSTAQYVGGNFIPVAALDLGGWPTSSDSNVDEEEPVPQGQNSPCNPNTCLPSHPLMQATARMSTGSSRRMPARGLGSKECVLTAA